MAFMVRVTRSYGGEFSVTFSRHSYNAGIEVDEKEIEEITLLLQEYSHASDGLENWVLKTKEADEAEEARRKEEKEKEEKEAEK